MLNGIIIYIALSAICSTIILTNPDYDNLLDLFFDENPHMSHLEEIVRNKRFMFALGCFTGFAIVVYALIRSLFRK